MIRLIVTADDNLYDWLASRTQDEGDVPRRATNALDGFKQAKTQPAGMIIVDMSLHAADTLLETLHSREETASIPRMAITADGQLPLALRRLCAAVVEVDSL
jgi:DNA-binding response OmpR family regulator